MNDSLANLAWYLGRTMITILTVAAVLGGGQAVLPSDEQNIPPGVPPYQLTATSTPTDLPATATTSPATR